MGRLRRFIVEYVGNLHLSQSTDSDPPMPAPDRRTNRYARELIDWIERQMEARGFPPTKKHELVNDLRHALRQSDPMPDGVSVGDGEGTPEWVPDRKGVSRDAPS